MEANKVGIDNSFVTPIIKKDKFDDIFHEHMVLKRKLRTATEFLEQISMQKHEDYHGKAAILATRCLIEMNNIK